MTTICLSDLLLLLTKTKWRVFIIYIYESENFSFRPFFFLPITYDRAEQNKMDFMGFSSRKDPKVQ
mgnify:CR=1 FL=1